LDAFHVNENFDMCNLTDKRNLLVPGCDHGNVASDSKEREKTTGEDVDAQSGNLTEHSAGEACFRQPQPLRIGSNYADQQFGNSRICLVMELLTGGTLVDMEYAQHDGTCREAFARDVAHTLLDTAAYMHERNWVHRDIKPANLVFTTKHADARSFKLVDFAFAIRLKPGEIANSGCGTPGFMPAEVVLHRQWCQVGDVWAVGAITHLLLYVMLACARTPLN